MLFVIALIDIKIDVRFMQSAMRHNYKLRFTLCHLTPLPPFSSADAGVLHLYPELTNYSHVSFHGIHCMLSAARLRICVLSFTLAVQ